jgi:hypothetical protein
MKTATTLRVNFLAFKQISLSFSWMLICNYQDIISVAEPHQFYAAPASPADTLPIFNATEF